MPPSGLHRHQPHTLLCGPPSPPWDLSCLSVHGTWTWCHSRCEFTCAAPRAVWRPLLVWSPTTSGSYSHFPGSSITVTEPWAGVGCNTDASVRAENSTVSYSLHPAQLKVFMVTTQTTAMSSCHDPA